MLAIRGTLLVTIPAILIAVACGTSPPAVTPTTTLSPTSEPQPTMAPTPTPSPAPTVTPTVAPAKPEEADGPEDPDKAQQHFERGVELADEGGRQEAVAELDESIRLNSQLA